MDNQQLQFRTAAVGGFNKQDVLNYLEQSARAHTEKVDALQRSLDEANGLLSTWESQAADYRSALAALEAERDQLAQELEGREEALALALRRAEALESQIAGLKVEIERLSPAAEAYRGLRDRAAGIELEAYTRAQNIEEEARRKAQEVRKELLSWVEGLQGTYSGMKTELESILARVARELTQAGQSVERLGDLTGPEAAIQSLKTQTEKLYPEMPQPLAVNEPLLPLSAEPAAPVQEPKAERPQEPVPFTREGEQ